ncbi:hypothetical protein CCACVL1_00694, partial [Corchorus capsularis]
EWRNGGDVSKKETSGKLGVLGLRERKIWCVGHMGLHVIRIT